MDDTPEIEDEIVVIAAKRRDAGKESDGHGWHDGPPGPVFEENSKSPGLARLLCHGEAAM